MGSNGNIAPPTYRYVICTPEGLAALQQLQDQLENQGHKLANRDGRLAIRVVIWAIEHVRNSGEVGITDEVLRADLESNFVGKPMYNLSPAEVTKRMRVIRRNLKPIVEAHCPDSENPKAS